jgi:hypothetical protein
MPLQITGTIVDHAGNAWKSRSVLIESLSTPVLSGSSVVATSRQVFVTKSDGTIPLLSAEGGPIYLVPGDYKIHLGTGDEGGTFNITVTTSGGSSDWSTLINDDLSFAPNVNPSYVLRARTGEVNILDYLELDSHSSSTDNSAHLQAAMTALTDGQTLVIADGDYGTSVPLTLTKNNVRVIFYGRIVALSNFTANSSMLNVTGTNITIDKPRLDGQNFALRGISIRPTSRSVTLNNPVLKNFQGLIGSTATPYAIGIRHDTRNITINDVDIDGVDNDSTVVGILGISRGIHITAESAGAAPYAIKIKGGSIKNVTPVNDGDGICFQNDWTEDLGSSVDGVTFEGCAKRGVKAMTRGVQVLNCTVVAPGYTGISLYGSDSTARGNRVIDCTGDMCLEVGAGSGVSISNLIVEKNILNMASGANVSGTGDGIRFNGPDISRSVVSGNIINHARIGIYLTGGISDTIVEANQITDTNASSIQASDATISAVVYTPDTVMVRGNSMRSAGNSVGVSLINVINPYSKGNSYNGTGTASVFTTCTGTQVQDDNPSDSVTGLLDTQFDRDTTGKRRIKDGAALQTISATQLNLTGPIVGTKSANFTHSYAIANTSSGASAFASFVWQNDTGKTVSFNLGGSGTTNYVNKAALIAATGITAMEFNFPTGATYDFKVAGVNSFQVDGDSTAGNTRMLVYDVTGGALVRVKVGGAGTGPGGSGKALYI